MISSAPINFKSFFGILFLIFTLVYLHTTPCQAQSQSFVYTLNTNEDAGINDAVEAGGKYIFVGWKDSLGVQYPYYFLLDSAGTFLGPDAVAIGQSGFYANIFVKQDSLLWVFSFPYLLASESDFYETEISMQSYGGGNSQSGVIQNSKLIDDSLLVTVGIDYNDPGYSGIVKVFNLNNPDPNNEYTWLTYSQNPIQFYDIIKSGNSYKLFGNSPNNVNQNQVSMLTIDSDSLSMIDSSAVFTSYSQYGDSILTGPVSVMSLTDSTFIIDGVAPHPLSANASDSLDVAQMIWNNNNNELSLNFLGAPDTNEYASPHSISKGDGYFYLGNTKNYNPSVTDQPSYFMLTKTDSVGNPIWTKYYGNGTRLKLTKVLATSDGGALMVGSSQALAPGSMQKVFVAKIDINGTLSGLHNLKGTNEFTTVLFPNPSTSVIHLSSTLPKTQKATLDIYDESGKLIRELPFTNDLNLNVSNYPGGVYLYRIVGGNGYSSGRFVVGK